MPGALIHRNAEIDAFRDGLEMVGYRDDRSSRQCLFNVRELDLSTLGVAVHDNQQAFRRNAELRAQDVLQSRRILDVRQRLLSQNLIGPDAIVAPNAVDLEMFSGEPRHSEAEKQLNCLGLLGIHFYIE